MRVRLDHIACQGHGRCYASAPDLFAPDEEGYVTLIRADVPTGLETAVVRAAGTCPERAIDIEPDDPQRSAP
jgi:ferredoxin